MTDVAIKNNTGRQISIPFGIDAKNTITENIVFKPGLNMLQGEAWDKIKNHPAIKSLTSVRQDESISRENIGEKKFANVSNRNSGCIKFEVNDNRNRNNSVKKEDK